MNAKHALLRKATAFLALIFYVTTVTPAFSQKYYSEAQRQDIPRYTQGMRLASNGLHDEGRRYIGIAVPSLKTDHYTTRLDSIHKKTDLQRKEVYSYDENYRIALRHDYVFAFNQDWQNWWQYFYEYNDLGYITLAWDQRWDNLDKKWVPYRKYEYTYNENNSIILYVAYEWNIQKEEWRYIVKEEYSYTTFFFLEEVLVSDWREPFGEEGRWVPEYKSEYIYNSSFALTEFIESNWREFSEEWRLRYRTVYERISLGRISVETIYSREDNEWVGMQKYQYNYPSGFNTSILNRKGMQFNWWETFEWENMDSLAFNYHPVSGFIESQEYYSWSTQDSIWFFFMKDDYLYDETFNLTNYKRERWSLILNDWESWLEEESYFNSSDLSAEYIVKPFWYEWRNMIDEYMARTWEFDRWRETNHSFFFYSSLDATSLAQTEKPVHKVYPNPAREAVYIHYFGLTSEAIFELYDITGKKVLSRVLSGPSKVNLEGIQKGLYLYHLLIPGHDRQSGKLILSGKQ